MTPGEPGGSLVAALIVVGYVAAVTAFGSWLGRRRRSVQDYFLAGRTVPWWAVAACIVATETSTLTFIGVPGTRLRGRLDASCSSGSATSWAAC